jgi:hypothetical protein
VQKKKQKKKKKKKKKKVWIFIFPFPSSTVESLIVLSLFEPSLAQPSSSSRNSHGHTGEYRLV